MIENKYDEEDFFADYSQMDRSTVGLQGAGEWHELAGILPDFSGKRLLDLGCGFGWHGRYAISQGATYVLGVDISKKMLDKAKELTNSPHIEYIVSSMEALDVPTHSFDIILSSLAFHYVKDFKKMVERIHSWLSDGGDFVFSVEHPVFTALGKQDWHYDADGKKLHWPVDNYFLEGKRQAVFLGHEVIKYHRTLTSYIKILQEGGFTITNIVEPLPEATHLQSNPAFQEELRRPMMLLIACEKKVD